ncbi:MAG: SpoIIE family protein phosphatase [Magnetococcus sp. DMHC-1]|nr:SpoIIE family protein phosphatase [Magnetococcales bacterium]
MTHPAGKQRVLIVDDEPANIDILVETLANYERSIALNGLDALKIAQSASPPDIVLLDIMMPGMDGFAVIQHLKSDPDTAHIPVIFITAMGQTEAEIKGFALGGADYISKPFSPAVVISRVKTHLALATANQLLQQQNDLLQYERGIMENIVAQMRQSVQFDGTNLHYLLSPLQQTTGDVLLSTFRPDQVQHVLLGDFAGHGLLAAVGAPLVADIFYSRSAKGIPMAEIVAETNQALCDKLPPEMFMAGSFLEVDHTRKQLSVWNCGLPDLHLFQDGQHQHAIPSSHMPRGMLHQPDTPPTVFSGSREIKIFACTDGVIDHKNSAGETFGEARYLAALKQIVHNRQPLDDMWKILAGFRENKSQDDDMILLELTLS